MVVCVNDAFPAETHLLKLSIPRRHEVYTVRSVHYRLNRRSRQTECRLLLEAIWNLPGEEGGAEMDWESARFDRANVDARSTHRYPVNPAFLPQTRNCDALLSSPVRDRS